MTDQLPISYGFFRDADGNRSFGRVASMFSLLAAASAFTVGLWMPLQAAYCTGAMNSLLVSAAGFYATSKGQQALTNWLGSPKSAAAPQSPEGQQ
jgi:hypothetical protein